MIRWGLGAVALFTAGAAHAQQSTTTGSPSNGTATVSPATVSDALNRPASSGSNFDLSLGTSFANGDFGSASDTHIWSTAFAARYEDAGGLRLSASIPYMRIRSNGTIFTGIDSTPVVASASGAPRRVTARGMGDLTIGGSFTTTAPGSDLEVEFSGRVKFPTATRKSRLSTGKTDFSAGVQLTKVVGSVAPFVSATYRAFGDPRAFDLRNGFAGSAGTSVIVGDRTVLLASYHYAEAATRFVSDSHELFAGASTQLGRSGVRLTGFATAGLSSGAPGVSGGVALSMKL